ncbi:TPA: NinH [Morganella morganii]|uniref:NinH n=1 Tax=Morganella morganii TaxID=582 RepID=UPI003305D5E0|nr:NinH [Morganella morganii]
MKPEITSIPEMLVKHHGNMTALASELEINRHTVRKFHRDTRCEMHVIYNGVLMTKSKMKGNQGRGQ